MAANRCLTGLARCLLALGWAAMGLSACRPAPPRLSGPFAQDAYVWQRHWTSNVVAAVQTHGPAFGTLEVLIGEVTWPAGRPRILRVTPDWPVLRTLSQRSRVGLALRIGPFPGPFEADDANLRFLRHAARESLDEARKSGIAVAGFQIDFDAAERQLDGYRTWVEGLRSEVAPVPLMITALPSWLNRRSFRQLAASTDGYVLQVHSLSRPRTVGEPASLCDPVAARRAVDKAAETAPDVPFRVALPTYGYLLAFGDQGTYLGASAEGPSPARPPGTIHRELSADPSAMAQLVADWTGDRPASMQGVIWYRLPVTGDRFNWRWPTLEKVMAGETPSARLHAEAISPIPGLTEVRLLNEGTADRTGPVSIRLRWTGAQRLGADGVRGFEAVFPGPGEVLFTNAICRLPAGEGGRIGWVRLDAHVPITLEAVVPSDPQPAWKP